MKNINLLSCFFICINLFAQNPNNEIPYSIIHALPLPQVTTLPAISNTHFDTLKYCFEEDSVNHEEPHSVGQNLFKTIDQIGEI